MAPILFITFLVLWLAFLGGTIGSFLNVVVYRVPAGMSVVHPPSRCPRCEHAIRWYDNIPVLGWLWLGGKCRDCSLPISPRYPIVEALTATMFLAVALADGVIGSWIEFFVSVRGAMQIERFVEVNGTYLIHVALIATLWTAALMQYDGKRMPGRLMLAAALLLGIAVEALAYYVDPLREPWHRGVGGHVLHGLMAGAFAMFSTSFWTWRDSERIDSRWTFVELAGICGLVIPIGSMTLVIAWAVLFGLIASLMCRRWDYPLLCLLAAVLLCFVAGAYYELPIHYLRVTYSMALLIPLFILMLMYMTEACFWIRCRSISGDV